jgi:hypothetical protein
MKLKKPGPTLSGQWLLSPRFNGPLPTSNSGELPLLDNISRSISERENVISASHCFLGYCLIYFDQEVRSRLSLQTTVRATKQQMVPLEFA